MSSSAEDGYNRWCCLYPQLVVGACWGLWPQRVGIITLVGKGTCPLSPPQSSFTRGETTHPAPARISEGHPRKVLLPKAARSVRRELSISRSCGCKATSRVYLTQQPTLAHRRSPHFTRGLTPWRGRRPSTAATAAVVAQHITPRQGCIADFGKGRRHQVAVWH